MSGCGNLMMSGGAPPVATGAAAAAFAGDTENAPSNAVATISFNSSGTQTCIGNGFLSSFTWLLSGAASAYDIRFNTASVVGTATLSGTALGSFVNMGTTRSITLTTVLNGVSSFDSTYDIAFTGSTVPIASGTLALDVEKVA